MVDRLIDTIRADYGNEVAKICFGDFRNNGQVAEVTEALCQNESIYELWFSFQEEEEDEESTDAGSENNNNNGGNNNNTLLNWDPLLHHLETRTNFHNVVLYHDGIPTGRFLPFFCNQFFQSIQKNTNLEWLILKNFVFPSNEYMDGMVSFLEKTPLSLTKISLTGFKAASMESAWTSAMALSRNRSHQLQKLHLDMCEEGFLTPIFRTLAAASCSAAAPSSSGSFLRTLQYTAHPEDTYGQRQSVAEALQQYLESTNSTSLRCLKLNRLVLNHLSGSSNILLGLLSSRNDGTTSAVSELEFGACRIVRLPVEPESDEDEEDLEVYYENEVEEVVQQITGLIQHKLSKLRITCCNFFEYQQFVDGITERVLARDSPLRCLEITLNGIDGRPIPIAAFRALMNAVASRSTRLEHLRIDHISDDKADHFQVLLETIPSFKVTDLTLVFIGEMEGQAEPLLGAFKRNLRIRSVQCANEFQHGWEDWFNDTNQAQLESYLDRNEKLAQWMVNPLLVPRPLWPSAIKMASEVGMDPLYHSLLALSGQEGIGLQHGHRKRKRPQYYSPL